MREVLNWNTSMLPITVLMAILLIAYNAYYLTAVSPSLKKKLAEKHGDEKGNIILIAGSRLWGALILGIIPAIIAVTILSYQPSDIGFSFHFSAFALISVFGIGGLLVFMNFFVSKNKEQQTFYPQIRKKEWDSKLVLLNAFSWIIYLLGYEFLFRGIILFPMAEMIGVWPAIALNIMIYSFVHIPKGAKEAIGAAPLGLFLCVLTLETGSFWPAFFIHCCLALSNDYFSIHHNANMSYIKREKI